MAPGSLWYPLDVNRAGWFLLASCLAASSALAEEAFEAQKVASTRVDASEYPGAAGVFLLVDEVFDQTGAGPKLTAHVLYRVLRPGGETALTFDRYYWQDFFLDYARTIAPDASEHLVEKAAVTFTHEARVGADHVRVAFPKVAQGATLEMIYTVISFDQAPPRDGDVRYLTSAWLSPLRFDPVRRWQGSVRMPDEVGWPPPRWECPNFGGQPEETRQMDSARAPLVMDRARIEGGAGGQAVNDPPALHKKQMRWQLGPLPGAGQEALAPDGDDQRVAEGFGPELRKEGAGARRGRRRRG